MNGYVWGPQEGPQTAAYYADWCDEVLFGGAKYGGKTDFLLGDYLSDVEEYGKHWQGILIRQSFTEFEEIVRRSHELYPQAGGEYAIQARTWRFPSGATLKLRYLERAQDFYRYNGHSYCVQVGTPILMADGSSKPIEAIQLGDYVATLEGPRAVKHVVAPYEAVCCEIVGDGLYQVQPIWHRLLSACGWQSYTSLLGNGSRAFEDLSAGSCRIQRVNVSLRCVTRETPGALLIDKKPSQCRVESKYAKLLCGKLSAIWHTDLKLYQDSPHIRAACQRIMHRDRDGGQRGVLLNAETGCYKALDSQCDCQFFHDLCDEVSPRALENAGDVVPKLSDAEGHTHERYSVGALGNTLKHSQQALCGYRHPYDGTERTTVLESELKACSITPCGKRLVADISVEGANHYINATNGIVNSNTWIGFDELGAWADPSGFKMMIGCLRWAEAEIPTKRIRCSANPGGAGQVWIAERYQIDRFPGGFRPFTDPISKMVRLFIPSKVRDNRLGLLRDPGYVDRLNAVGSPELVKAWLHGLWDQKFGAYFKIPLFRCRPFEIPNDWLKFRAFDYGAKSPFSVGWYAVSPGVLLTVEMDDGESKEVFLPPNCLIRYREWYGMLPGQYNVGLDLDFDQLADGIVKRSGNETYAYSVADPSIFKHESGPSIAEELYTRGVNFAKADNSRVSGWRQVYQRINGSEGNPMLVVFDTCTELIRTLPLMQHDIHNPEDVDTNLEDHAADELRYGCNSRPYISEIKEAENKDPFLAKNLLEETFARSRKKEFRV